MPHLTAKPSDKFSAKTIDPFKTSSKFKTPFGAMYSRDGIPARLDHGSVKHKLHWSKPPEDLPFDPLLVLMAEGIRETEHPLMFVARVGFADMLAVEGSSSQVIPIIPKLIAPIRAALVCILSPVWRIR